MSSLFQVTDPETHLSVTLNLALAQAGNIPTDGLWALGLAQLSEEAGAFQEAQRYIDVASQSLKGAPDARMRAKIESDLYVASGNLQRDLGGYAQAFQFYGRAVEKYRSVEDHKDAAATLNKIGEVYRQIGDKKASAQWYEYALQESRKAGDLDGQFTALIRLYFLAAELGDQVALARYDEQSKQLVRSMPRSREAVLALANGDSLTAMGEIGAESGDPDDAISFLLKLIAVYQKFPWSEQTARKIDYNSVFLGDAYMRVGHYDQALAAYSDAEAIAERYHSPEVLWIYRRIGTVQERRDDLKEALRSYERAAQELERLG